MVREHPFNLKGVGGGVAGAMGFLGNNIDEKHSVSIANMGKKNILIVFVEKKLKLSAAT